MNMIVIHSDSNESSWFLKRNREKKNDKTIFSSIKIPQITFLFGKEYNDDVLLSGRYQNKTVYLRIMNIQYSTYIAKIPGMQEKDFEQFLAGKLPRDHSFEKIYMRDSTVSTLNQNYCFYKITAPKQSLKNLVYMKKFDEKNFRQGFGYTEFFRNTYLTPYLQPQSAGIYEISVFYQEYLRLLYSIDRNTLKGIEYLIYPYVLFPFRNTKQDLSTIQNEYNINFFDTLEIPDNIQPQVSNKYACDFIYYVDITQLKNVQSVLTKELDDYWCIMFDIENAVYIQQQHNNQPPTMKLLEQNEKFYHSDNYYKFVSQFRETEASGFYDYNQIICVSCIEQSFSGNFGKKIALVNSSTMELPEKEQIKDMINKNYEQDQVYADEVIVCNSEKQLLIELIKILSNHRYHIISHFNGWNFDERMIMSRMCLYENLFDLYYYKMRTVKNSLQESDRWNLSYKSSYKNGTGMSADKHDLCMLRDGLRMSFDVYQICLHDSIESQKHDNNSLNGLLEFYGLGLKGDISYQDLTDAFYNKDVQLFIKGVWYCQRDSIQQCVLQHHLKQIISYSQYCSTCHIPLHTSIQNAVGAKVQSTVAYFTQLCNLPLLDIVPPYQIPQEELTNIGGEVICFQPGYSTYVTAVDASSMYPAQVEANNLSNDCMLYPHELIYILNHLSDFGYTKEQVHAELLHDMYSPSNNSWQRIPEIEQYITNTIDNIYYIQQPNEKPLKYYRYRIYIGNLIYEQFFFQKKNMSPIYNYVFYLQGKDENGHPFSPLSRMLTTFRFQRKAIKQKMKQEKNPIIKMVYNAQQNSMKIVMNSTYGGLDVTCYFTFSLIGPSTITYQSRCIIQNCRDHLVHQFHKLTQNILDKIRDTIEVYHKFIYTVFINPTEISIRFPIDGILQLPELKMKYQDTDSNYFLMPKLDNLEVKQQYKKDESYCKIQTFGLFNDVLRSFINSAMNKFPLEFGFEGMFYKAWHIQKKMYLGQKTEQYVCHLLENGDLIRDYEMKDIIDLSDFNPETQDIYKYIDKNHIKITGLQVIKRNTTILVKRYYIKLIESVLNQNQENMITYLVQLLNEFKEEFHQIPQKQFFVSKKISENDMTKPYLIEYNRKNPNQQLGLGMVMNTVVVSPGDVREGQFYDSQFSVEKYTVVISQEDENKVNNDIYYGYYLWNMAKNLLTFIQPEDDDINEYINLPAQKRAQLMKKQTKELLKQSELLQIGRTRVSYKINSVQDLDKFIALYQFWQYYYKDKGYNEFFDNNIKWNIQNIYKTLSKFLRDYQYVNHPQAINYCNQVRDLFMKDCQ